MVSDLIGVGSYPNISISNKFACDADAVDQGVTFEKLCFRLQIYVFMLQEALLKKYIILEGFFFFFLHMCDKTEVLRDTLKPEVRLSNLNRVLLGL